MNLCRTLITRNDSLSTLQHGKYVPATRHRSALMKCRDMGHRPMIISEPWYPTRNSEIKTPCGSVPCVSDSIECRSSCVKHSVPHSMSCATDFIRQTFNEVH